MFPTATSTPASSSARACERSRTRARTLYRAPTNERSIAEPANPVAPVTSTRPSRGFAGAGWEYESAGSLRSARVNVLVMCRVFRRLAEVMSSHRRPRGARGIGAPRALVYDDVRYVPSSCRSRAPPRRRRERTGESRITGASFCDANCRPPPGARTMPDSSRRRFLASLGAAAIGPSLVHPLLEMRLPLSDDSTPASRGVRVRAITAGVAIDRIGDRASVERALALLARARATFEHAGYEVQTTRITMPPVLASLDATERSAALATIADLDALVTSKGAVCSLGPVLTADRADDDLADWSSEMVKATKSTSFSAVIASPAVSYTHLRAHE